MGEDDIVELLWKSGQAVQSSLTQRANSDNPSPPPVLRGSGSGGGGGSVEENALLPVPQPPPTCPMHHQNLFMQEDEMASWLHHPLRQDYIGSELLYSGAASTPATQPQSSLSLAAPPSSPYGQSVAGRREENFMDFWRLRENILTGGRVEAGPVVIESTQTGSSTFPATESYLTPATHDNESPATFFGGVSRTFAVPSRGPKDKAVAIQTEIAGTSSLGVETEPVQIQPATETEIADDTNRNEREETNKTEEAPASTSRKRSRTAEMHNLAEKTRRQKINDKIKTLQELIPHCSKSSRASMLEDVIKHVQSLHMQLQMMSAMMPPMYAVNMQQFMPHMAIGMMDMNRPPPFIPFPGTPFPSQAHTAVLSPSSLAPRYPVPNFQPSDPSRVHLPSLQPGSNPVSNQPQFLAYMNPYSQFVGLHQTQQPPPPLQSQTTSQPSFGQASSSKEPEDQDNQPTG